MITRVRILVVLAVFAFASRDCFGSQTYWLINNPELQRGASLSGTITVCAHAADDGFLEAGEVIDWSWSASSDPWLSYAARLRTDAEWDPVNAWNVEIDSSGIYLPTGEGSAFGLVDYSADLEPQRVSGLELYWNANESWIASELFQWTWRDGWPAWFEQQSRDPTAGRWMIARAIPEPPAASILIAAGAMLSTLCASRRRVPLAWRQ